MIMCAMTMIMNGGFFKDDMVICGSRDEELGRNGTGMGGGPHVWLVPAAGCWCPCP